VRQAVIRSCWLGIACLSLLGCEGSGKPSGPSVSTNSNWLRSCSDDDPCATTLDCRCSACTLSCASDADCEALEGAHCASGTGLAVLAACDEQGATQGMCLPRCAPGECLDGQACVGNACVLAPMPDLAACDPAADSSASLRALEDELLDRLQDLRLEGGAVCGSADPSRSAAALRFDPRLLCAARVLAQDIDATGMTQPLDSQGRSTQDRLMAAGYTSTLWADAFAFDFQGPADALDILLADPLSCARLVGPDYTEVAVGAAGSVLVVTLARP